MELKPDEFRPLHSILSSVPASNSVIEAAAERAGLSKERSSLGRPIAVVAVPAGANERVPATDDHDMARPVRDPVPAARLRGKELENCLKDRSCYVLIGQFRA